EHFRNYALSIVTTKLSSNAVLAYQTCMLQNGGLLLLAQDKTQDHYIISLHYSPFPGASKKKGRVGIATNVTAQTLQGAKNDVNGAEFGAVNMQFTLQPEDPTRESSIEVIVGGSESQVVVL